MNIKIMEKNFSEINTIKPLWEKLNLIHLEKSVYFKSKYETFTFEKRISSVSEKVENGKIKLDTLIDVEKGKCIGYCLSSIEEDSGEIESIFIEEEYRKFKLGDKLMKSALNWFETNKIEKIEICVVYANDDALTFYERYGFHIGNYTLKRS